MLEKKVEKKFPSFPPMALIPCRCKAERVGKNFKTAKKFPTFDIKFPTFDMKFPALAWFLLIILLTIDDMDDIIEL